MGYFSFITKIYLFTALKTITYWKKNFPKLTFPKKTSVLYNNFVVGFLTANLFLCSQKDIALIHLHDVITINC